MDAETGLPKSPPETTDTCRDHPIREFGAYVFGGNSEEECEAKRRALIADGEAAEDDMFVFLVPPKPMKGSAE